MSNKLEQWELYEIRQTPHPYNKLLEFKYNLSHKRGELYLLLRKHILQYKQFKEQILPIALSCLTEDQKEQMSQWLSTGCFDNLQLSTDEQKACYATVLDAEYIRELREQTQNCSKYEGNEPIFQDTEIKAQRNDDLINYKGFRREPNSNIIKVGRKWGYLDPRVPLQFYDWIEQCFKNSQSRVRIDPNGLFDTRPPQMVVECVINPGRYKWWNKLGRYCGDGNGSEYHLLGNDPSNHSDYYDYHSLHVRRLETIAKRRDAGYFSMQVEELSEYPHPFDSNRKYVIGRMIHLDTTAPLGATIDNAILKHIDLAFNMYIDDAAKKRLSETLSGGEKTQDGKPRTHILRVDNVPFNTLFKFAESFFRSKTLVAEWLDSEFKEII